MLQVATIFDRSIKKILVLLCVIFAIIIIRLFYLQVYLTHELFARAQKNYTRTLIIPSSRGNILDCNGQLIATNRPVINIHWQGTGNRTINPNQMHLLQTIMQLNNQIIDEQLIKLINYGEKYRKIIPLCIDISFETLSKIIEKFSDHPNLFIENQLKRHYPYKTVASHIVGYIGSIEYIGKMGLEKALEAQLKGESGTLITMINSVGTKLYEYSAKHALSGQSIQTTLDIDLQLIAEQCFHEDQTGVFLLLDPQTGDIKALVSRPTFDPNIFLSSINPHDWTLLQERRPFLNRAFNACYPPASPFKLITLSAALELGIVSPETVITCKGFTRFHDRLYHCAKQSGHGKLTIEDAVAQSCNILFFEIGKHISVDQLAEYAHRFGFGQKTNILFGEQSGLVPTRAWKLQTKGESWWAGETLSTVIGQGYLLATPIQVACMIGSIFTGFLVTPRILKQEPIKKKSLEINTQTCRYLKKYMKAVVTKGTGAHIKSIPDMKIYAKTGTAQVSDLSKRNLGLGYLEHAWFVSYVSYKDEAPFVLLLLIEHAGSSRIATSVAKRFLKEYRSFIETKSTQGNQSA